MYIRCGDEFIKVNESYNEQSCLDLNQFEDMDIYDIRIIAYLNNKIQKSFVMSFEMFENNLIYVNHDTDNDGIEDGYEIMDLNTNPYSKDTDNDGYSDFYEVNISGTNPKSYNEEASIDSGNFDYNNMKYDICVGGLNKDEVKIINQLTNKVKYIENCNGKYIYLYDENNNLLRVSFKNPNGETYHTFYTYENNNLKSIRKNNNLYEFNYTENNDIEEIKVNGSIISQNNYTKNSESLISEKKYGNGQTISNQSIVRWQMH